MTQFASFFVFIKANFWSVNLVSCNECLLEFRFDLAQTFLGFHTVAEIACTQEEMGLYVSQIDWDVGEGPLKTAFYGFGVIQGFVTDFAENMNAVAAERAVDFVKRTLFCNKAFDAAVLVNMQ